MSTAANLRAKRNAADIPGHAVAKRAEIGRSRLSDIELGHVEASQEELERIAAAIGAIESEKKKITQLAADNGLELAGIRL
jgi:transcriptional regulator with XRE-family HTH domain